MRAALTANKAWAELGKVLEAAARTKRGEQDVALLVELATLLWKRLEQPDMAESFFRRVRKLEPSNRAMVEFYREYYTTQERAPAAAGRSSPRPRRRRGTSIAGSRWGSRWRGPPSPSPSTPTRRSRSGRGCCVCAPHMPDAVAALRALYTRTEKWNALLELLKEDLDAVPAANVDEKVTRYLEIVGIYRDRLNLEVMVVNTYLAILGLKPDHPEALSALAARYEAQGRFGDLVQILTRQAESSTDAGDAGRAAPADRRAVGRQARQAPERGRQLREDLRVRPERRRDGGPAQGPLRQGAGLAPAHRGAPARAAARRSRGPPRPSGRDGPHRQRASQ